MENHTRKGFDVFISSVTLSLIRFIYFLPNFTKIQFLTSNLSHKELLADGGGKVTRQKKSFEVEISWTSSSRNNCNINAPQHNNAKV